MRLWHYKLIPYLPNSQLIAQWRELNSIFKKQNKHILINYIYEYPKKDLFVYSCMIIDEMEKRHFKILSLKNMKDYFKDYYFFGEYKPFKNHHNNRYLKQCFYNLQEKSDRGQKDFSNEIYDELFDFIQNEFEEV